MTWYAQASAGDYPNLDSIFHNLHPTAAILIQHPLWDQNLHSTGKRHLDLV